MDEGHMVLLHLPLLLRVIHSIQQKPATSHHRVAILYYTHNACHEQRPAAAQA